MNQIIEVRTYFDYAHRLYEAPKSASALGFAATTMRFVPVLPSPDMRETGVYACVDERTVPKDTRV